LVEAVLDELQGKYREGAPLEKWNVGHPRVAHDPKSAYFRKISMRLRISTLFMAVLALTVFLRAEPPPADIVPFAGLSPKEAVAKATLPPGFQLHLFAGEPDIVQPIAFCLDHRGRVWVAEGLSYPRRREEGKGIDRILCFEDTNGDHHFDRCTVVMTNLNLVSGLEWGFGGLWVGAAPYLMYIPILDGDVPKAAGAPKILLDGWNFTADTHETLNTLTWGPDGWLYGCHGVFCPSHVGKPGAPESERQWVDAAVWRYHPATHAFEIFSEGGSNPWGIDFDERGQLWAEMCVIPHLHHLVQGGRYIRQGGEHFTINAAETARNSRHRDVGSRKPIFPYVYEDIQTVADHLHWAGGSGPHAANGRSDAMGGGHAHAGMMCYLGTSWPEEYRGKLIIGNIHGQRLNMDIPEPAGSGYVGHHGKDFLNFNDTWSQTLNQRYDQDGSVYIIDWYDKNQCHHNREDGHDRSNGRIYQIVYNNQPHTPVDLNRLSDDDLVRLVPSRNEWMSAHARRVLQERLVRAAGIDVGDPKPGVDSEWSRLSAASGKSAIRGELKTLLAQDKSSTGRLRALWGMQVTAPLTWEEARPLMEDSDEWIRSWSLQLVAENSARWFAPGTPAAAEFVAALIKRAKEDPSPVVRRYVASALQRFPVDARWTVLTELVRHGEDAGDHYLPLMYWYAAEGSVATDPGRGLDLLRSSRIPKVREWIARRIAALSLASN